MGYKLVWDDFASNNLDKLDSSVRKQILKFLDKLDKRDDPRTLGEALEENLAGYWKYRVGNYRIIAEIQDDKLIIILIAIGHRDKIYRITDKRLNK